MLPARAGDRDKSPEQFRPHHVVKIKNPFIQFLYVLDGGMIKRASRIPTISVISS